MFRHALCFTLLTLSLCKVNPEDCTDDRCRIREDTLRFLLLGDWGGFQLYPYFTPSQKKVSAGMAKVSDSSKSDFVLALGDNFYFLGVKSSHDKRFNKTFEDIYTAKSLQVPWYCMAGNHDHHGNVSAQIHYTKLSKLWHFPHYYYTIKYQLEDDTKVDIVVIDTVLLCGNVNSDFKINEGIRFSLNGPEDVEGALRQWTWIEQQLNSSKANYLFVAGHYPVWSIGEHGPSQCLIEKLAPLFTKYKVSAYFSGHDHNLQYLHTTSLASNGSYWTTHFILSGTGAYMDGTQKHKESVPPGSSAFFYPTGILERISGKIGMGGGGFVSAEVDEDEAKFVYWKGNGVERLYEVVVAPRYKK